MKDRIRKILREEANLPKPYKYSEGGYIVPSDLKEHTLLLTDEEFKKLEPINNSMKNLYESKKEYLETLVQHNKGVIQHALKKMRSEG